VMETTPESMTIISSEHLFEVHTKPDSQSLLKSQCNPLGHLFGHDPPQSTSDSVPLKISSLQESISSHVPAEQNPDSQSLFRMHALPSEHLPHNPPQSVDVSSWFLVPSLQVGTVQTPLEQNLLLHWKLPVHDSPMMQSPLSLQVISVIF